MMRKGSITADFLLIVVGLIVLVVIMSTAFGKGVLVSMLGYFAAAHPQYLAEEFSIYLTAAGHTPGNFSAPVSIGAEREMEMRFHSFDSSKGPEISVKGAVAGSATPPSHAASFLNDTSALSGICNATQCWWGTVAVVQEGSIAVVNRIANDMRIDIVRQAK